MSTSLDPPQHYGATNDFIHGITRCDQFQEKVFKVMLDAGFTCPTATARLPRAGALLRARGSGDFAGRRRDDLVTQFNTIRTGTRSGRAPNTSVISKPIPTRMLR